MYPDEKNLEEDPTVLDALRRYFNKPAEGNVPVDIERAGNKESAVNRLVFVSLLCFLVGQFLIEFFREALSGVGVLFLFLGFALAAIAFLRERKRILPLSEPEIESKGEREIQLRLVWLLAAFLMSIGASLIYRRGQIDFVSALLWIGSIIAVVAAFFQTKIFQKPDFKSILNGINANRRKLVAYLLLIAVVLIFQFGRLEQVPPEIISSQVEAYYTVDGITKGDTSLWFPRNVVSEPGSYHWAGLVNRLIPGQLSFTGLKLAYALAGLVSIFFMYKLGRRLFDEKSGYISALLLGVSFWAILQQRAVLGFGLILPIMLPALFYLVKSLQEDDLNALLISSVLTGMGLLTNKIFIVIIVANLVITIVYLAGKRNVKLRLTIALRIGIGILVGIVVVLPLIFVVAANPNGWLSPIVGQLSITGNQASSSPILTFFNNLLSALGMMNWLNRSSWVDGIANRAALDWVSGAFFLFGICVTLFHDFFRDRKQSISLLVLLLLMLLPSAFSIAQPMENPSLSRALGTAIPVFLIAGRGFALAIDSLELPNVDSAWVRQAIFVGFFTVLIVSRNFSLINTTYLRDYQNSAWNATEMAAVIRNYDTGQAGSSQAYIVGYPYWVDARSVAISLGEPYVNLSILPQDLSATVDLRIARIFLLHLADTESLGQLQSLYPAGIATNYQSILPDKGFIIFIASQ